MPLENLEDESLEKNPNLELAQKKFLLSLEEFKNDQGLKNDLMVAIKEQNMGPFLKLSAEELGWYKDKQLVQILKEMKFESLEAFLKTLQAENEKELKRLDDKITDAETNLGEMEVREAYLAKAEYLSRIGEKEAAITAFRKTYEKTTSLGHRLDLLFHLIRIGLFFMDYDLVQRNIEKAKGLIEEGGDWDRRNRLKVYQGVYCMSVRDFKGAANFFLESISTFTCYELMDYQLFVRYTVLCSIISLPRVTLREKVIRGAEILEVLHGIPDIREYLFSLYNCQYGQFFSKLAYVENLLAQDRLLAHHYRYYVREMRILAYTQLLESYQSLTLQYMAEAFGVTIDFIDQELARFIAAGRLHCKIDKVGGIVETNRPDNKNYQYQACIKQGDILLNRIQKLSRVINI